MEMPKKLFSPVNIGTIQVKNRIVMPAMVTSQATPDGMVTERHIGWYEARAKGGVGLIIIEFTSVAKRGQTGANMLGIWDDKFIPGLRRLVERIHAYDTKVFLQLSHGGRQTSREFNGGQLPVAPSAIVSSVMDNEKKQRNDNTHEIPNELSVEEIEKITGQFAEAGSRAKQAGFDGVEIHGAHGYLIGQFMSPYSNKRHDEYGGDLTARMEFPLEVVRAVRSEVGTDFPIGFRCSGNEHVPDGITMEDTKRIAPMLEAAGVNCLHISAGVYESFWSMIPPYGTTEGFHANEDAAIKQTVSIPVITVGRIKSPEIAEKILQHGKADLVALGRQLICDPDWPVKVATGNFGEIRPCIGCTQGCINRQNVEGKPASCTYNTAAGIENEAEILSTKNPKNVLVIGGGPGGLEAARVAAVRGHHVTLFEKTGKLGGRFNLACVAPFKQEFTLAIKWLVGQVNKLGVHIELGREVTPELVSEIKPDIVIIATGAATKRPEIPGMDKEGVVIADDILAGKVAMGNKVVILGGGGIGCEVADFIVPRGKDVTIVEMMPEIGVGTGIPLIVAQLLIPRLKHYGVKMMTCATVQEVIDNGVIVNLDGKEEKIIGDQIIVAMGAKPINELADSLKNKVPEVYVIGDAKEPRTMFEATHEGAEIARMI
jgi:2,4-dienoyl-CoA reductase-like NADH-dependent reductase (Old Yellow Enzyme family)/thioredoxin reductase